MRAQKKSFLLSHSSIQNRHDNEASFSYCFSCRCPTQRKNQTAHLERLGENPKILAVTHLENHIQTHNHVLQEAYLALSFACVAHCEANHEVAMQAFWAAIDRYFEKVASFPLFSCRSGCSHCCFDNPHGVTGMELTRILPLLTEAQKNSIINRAKEYKQLVQSNPNPQALWKTTCTPCPLLEENKCSIYTKRPLACRSFFSLSPSQWCHPKHENYQSQPQIDCDLLHARLVECATQRGLTGSTDLLTGLASLLEEQ